MNFDYDLLVIGAGPGGLAASEQAAGYGARVAIAEQDSVGGTCVLRGCIPEKLALHNRGMNCIHASIQERAAKMQPARQTELLLP